MPSDRAGEVTVQVVWVQISPELVKILSEGWSDPVQVRITDKIDNVLVLEARRVFDGYGTAGAGRGPRR